MDMGFSRRRASGQKRDQAEQLAILLSEIATRQAATPTARIQMQMRQMADHQGDGLAVSAFASAFAGQSPKARTCAFHERVANSVGTENQER